MRRTVNCLRTLLLVSSLMILALPARAQDTQFTYQGSLNNGGVPANGSFDFEFALFTAVSGGSPVSANFISPFVTVTNGLFSLKINFGPNFPTGVSRFLEIRVRPTGGGAYTTLTPRQQITSEPYAINSAQLGGIDANQYLLSGTATINAATQFNLGGNRFLSAGGTANTYVGIGAGANSNTLSDNNAFFGTNAGTSMVTGGGNSFFGSDAGMSATSGGDSFFGFQAGRLTTTGDSNSFFGNGAGRANTTGSNNAFFGRSAGFVNQTGSGNSFFGFQAGNSSNTGNNSFFGYQSGKNATGINNSFFGWSSGLSTTTGTNNTFVGVQAGLNNTTGIRNVFIGRDAGIANVTGSNNTLIGYNARVASDDLSFATVIGSGAVALFSNVVVLGRSSDQVRIYGDLVVDNVFTASPISGEVHAQTLYALLGASGATNDHVCYGAFNNVDFKLVKCDISSIRFKKNVEDLKQGIELVRRLRPVTFNWKEDGRADLGFIAEEVSAVEPLLARYDEKGEIEGVKYDRISVVLVNAVKEQQAQIDAQKNEIQSQAKEIGELRSRLEILKEFICAANTTAEICKPKN